MPCAQFDGPTPKTGQIKILANANSAAYNYIDLSVIPQDGTGNIRIDTGAQGSCTGTISGTACNGGHWYSRDVGLQLPGNGPKYAGYVPFYPTWRWTDCFTPGSPCPMFPSNAAPTAVGTNEVTNPGEVRIYETYVSDSDLTYTIVVPNGNYQVRSMFAMATAAPPIPRAQNKEWVNVFETQDSVKFWNYCWLCKVYDDTATPADLMIPAKVTDNILEYGQRGSYLNRYGGWSPQTSSGSSDQQAYLTGLNVLKDTTSTPHWEVGNYIPNDPVPGDATHTPINNGLTVTTTGAIPPGVYQFYIRDWDTGVNDPVWTINSGAVGTLSSTGLYVAPTTVPPVGTCDLITATSASNSEITASVNMCIDGSPVYKFH